MRNLIVLTAVMMVAGMAMAAEPVMAPAPPQMPPQPAPFTSIGIVAVVDDQVISSTDLADRVALVMGTTGIPDTPENRAHIIPQIMHQLIDEKLQMEEAAKLSIVISDAKVEENIARIEKQSGHPPGSLSHDLQAKGLSKQSFYAQVRAQMAWSEIVLRKIRPRIHISDQEVARFVKRKETSPSAGAKEVMIATIQLPVDAPSSEAGIKKLADKLTGEIRSGASFEAVASQFSASTGGTKASDPFWVELSQIDPVIGAALAKTPKGSITDPVRTANGYQIVKFIDERQVQAEAAKPETEVALAELAFKEILMTLKPDDKRQDAELLLHLAKEVSQAPGKCEDKTIANLGDLGALDFKVSFIRGVSNGMSEKLRDLLMSLKVGGISEPVITPQGIRLFMLCERIDLPPAKISPTVADDAARQAIYKEKLELEAEKYLRNLRRDAFVEIRSHG